MADDFGWGSRQQAELTLDDLSINDSLTQVQRIERYVTSPIPLQRLVHVKLFSSTAVTEGIDVTRSVLLPLLGVLTADDKIIVRQQLPEQIVLIAEFLSTQGEEGYLIFVESLLPCLARLLHDHREEVRQAASEAFVRASKLVRFVDIGRHVLSVLLRLAHDDDQESLRMTAVWLLNELAPCLGTDISVHYLVPEMLSLAEDPEVRIRRQVVWNFKKIFKFLQGNYRLTNCFLALTKDESFRVRKACTEVIPDLSTSLPIDKRGDILLKVYMRLLQDAHKRVRGGALENLALFMVTLDPSQISTQLVGEFVSMSEDAELKKQCAFYFPAVLFSIGPSRWPEVRDGYLTLAQSRVLLIKRTLAHSFHEVAKMLGSDIVEEDLLSVFEGFIQDSDETVSFAVLNHFAQVLACVSPSWRQSYLYLLKEVLEQGGPMNWRLRESVASQLKGLAPLLEPKACESAVVATTLILMKDKVASVRTKALTAVSAILQCLESEDEFKDPFVANMLGLADGTVQDCQSFAVICGEIIQADIKDESLVSSFIARLTLLASSASPSPVRVAITMYIRQNPWTQTNQHMSGVIQALQQDTLIKS